MIDTELILGIVGCTIGIIMLIAAFVLKNKNKNKEKEEC